MDRHTEKSKTFEEGEELCRNGDFGHAAQLWEQSLIPSDGEVEAGSVSDPLIHLTHAYQAIGHYENALSLLNAALPFTERQGGTLLKALINSRLGDIHLRLGEMTQAEQCLKKSVEAARSTDDPLILASALNHMGIFHAVDEDHEAALLAWQESLERLDSVADEDGLRSKVLLNLIRFKSHGEYEDVSMAELEDAHSQITGQPDSHAKVADMIALSLLVSDMESPAPLAPDPASLLKDARRIAESLGDTRMASYACGYLGKSGGNDAEAVRLTREAIFLAQQTRSPEILYRWQWQLGRLFRAQGDGARSIRHYQAIRSAWNSSPDTMTKGTGLRRRSGRSVWN